MRELHERTVARSERALQHTNLRAIALTTRGAQRDAHRKCLTFAYECVSMHVMHNSNAAVARGEKGSLSSFGAGDRSKRTVFTGRNMQTAEAIEIAAFKDVEVSAGAGFTSAVS